MNLRRSLTIILLLAIYVVTYATDYLDRFLQSAAIDAGSTAVMVLDLRTGEITESYNIDVPLMPASTMKSVTVAALLEKVGPHYKYHTKVYLDGTPGAEGVWNGNLIVVGSGDPSLNSTKNPKSSSIVAEIVQALRKKGIKEIQGQIIVDESIFPGSPYPSSWEADNKQYSYGAGTFGLNFENNLSGKTPVGNPAGVFRQRLASALEQAGISLGNENLKGGKRVYLTEHVSPAIEEMMRSCMMRSDNMFAESFLRTYGVEIGVGGSYDKASKEAMSRWGKRGAPMEGVSIRDGSGLSRENRLTARFLAFVLRKLSYNVEYASFFPLAGQEGTLRNFLKGTHLDSYIALKTGTLRDVRAFAGYKLDEDFAPTHAVVILMNKVKSTDGASRAAANLLLEVFPTP